MKRILLALLLLTSSFAFAQNPVQVTQPQWFLNYTKSGPYTTATLPTASTCVGCLVYNGDIHNYEFSDGTVWAPFTSSASNGVDSLYQHGDSLFYLTPNSAVYVGKWLTQVDSSVFVTHTALNDSLAPFVRLQTQNPLASLSPSQQFELTAASTQSVTLSWASGRQAATATALATNPIATINVGGVLQSFSQPLPGDGVSGTQAVTITTNTTTSLFNVTTTTDSKVASASVTDTYLPRRYYGLVTDTTGIGTTAYNNAVLLALQNDLTTSKVLTNVSTGTPSGVEFWVYIYPADEGALSQLSFNGFSILANGVNLATRDFTNALGFTQPYNFVWTKNGQTSSSLVIAQ